MKIYQIRENILMGLETLRRHPMRSFLTVLGVLIGVATVILIASILTGMRSNILALVEQYGTENIYAFHLSTGFQAGPRMREEFQREPMRTSYADALREQSDHIADVAYQGFTFGFPMTLRVGDREFTNAQLLGVSPNHGENTGVVLSEGRFISEIDDMGRRMVCVLGYNAVDALFSNPNRVLGKRVTLRGGHYTIIGVLEKAKTTFFGQNDLDNSIYLPYRTFQKAFPRSEALMLIVRARPGHLSKAYDDTESILRRVRGLKSMDDNDFTLNTYDLLVDQFDAIVGQIGLFVIAFSGLGLLVGGIGVMNIMLVSVTERTREIGVRKAMGARRRDITFQFLFEAATLTSFGGAVGIALSVGGSALIRSLLPGLPASIPIWAVVAGVVVSTSVGLIFGVFPAVKASRLDPIECLRYE